MSWFKRRGTAGDDPSDQERAAQQAVEAVFDPYSEQTLIVEGEQAAIMPGRVLENLRNRMERVDLDPETLWVPEDLMSQEESVAMFIQLGMGELVITETAWFARQILSRWPAEFVEHPVNAEARISMFFDGPGPTVDAEHDDAARKILNRALASPDHVEEHPELADATAQQLVAIWLALTFWYGIKSGFLNHQARQADD